MQRKNYNRRLITSFCVLCVGLTMASCNNLEQIERADNFKPDHSTMHSLVILPVDFYYSKEKETDVYKNKKAFKIEKMILKSAKRASLRFGLPVTLAGVDEKTGPVYFNDVERLKQELSKVGFLYNFDKMDVKINYPNIEPLSASLILSPDLEKLEKVYGTPYFFYTLFVNSHHKLIALNVLADVSSGKIVYREIMVVGGAPHASIVKLMMFNIFNDILRHA